MSELWDHPDWYDLHDAAHSAGSEREPEHYRELILALPALGPEDHLLDAGAGTGKLALMIANAYPGLGRLTLLEPNVAKLERARQRLTSHNPQLLAIPLEELDPGVDLAGGVSVLTLGSVLMPTMEYLAAAGQNWLDEVLGRMVRVLKPGGRLFALETVRLHGTPGRLTLLELTDRFSRAGLRSVETLYRFRDRVILSGTNA